MAAGTSPGLDGHQYGRRVWRVPPASAPPAPSTVRHPSPARSALALLFEDLRADGRHAILDLGMASRSRLRLLGRYGRQIRFAGLLPPSSPSLDLGPEAASIPANREQPYDVVLAWDLLDHLDDVRRESAVQRLDEITSPDARLYVVVASGGGASVRPVRMDLVDLDVVSHELVGPQRSASPELLPARVEKLLTPFQVVRAVSLRIGMREYVARKRGTGAPATPSGGEA